jgi:hypothetical protein
MKERPPIKWPQTGLLALSLLVLSGVSPGAYASELCDLNYRAAARGQFAVQGKPEQFVFRTQRRLLEPPTIDGVDAYYDVAEDAALESLAAYMSQQSSVKNGQLQMKRTTRPQRIRCAEAAWTVFSFDLSKVSWVRSDGPVAAPALAPGLAPGVAPAAAFPPAAVPAASLPVAAVPAAVAPVAPVPAPVAAPVAVPAAAPVAAPAAPKPPVAAAPAPAAPVKPRPASVKTFEE